MSIESLQASLFQMIQLVVDVALLTIAAGPMVFVVLHWWRQTFQRYPVPDRVEDLLYTEVWSLPRINAQTLDIHLLCTRPRVTS